MRWSPGLAAPLWLALLALVGGCLEPLPEPSRIEGLRVLGIQAEPPELGVGETSTLQVLVVDSEERPITYRWTSCILPERRRGLFGGSAQIATSGGKGFGLDDPGTCTTLAETEPDEVTQLGSESTAVVTVPFDLSDPQAVLELLLKAYDLPEPSEPPDGEGPPENVEIPKWLMDAVTEAGLNITVSLEVTAGDARLDTFKRVNVSLDDDKNENPAPPLFHIRHSDSDEEAPVTAPAPSGGGCFIGEDDGPIRVRRGTWILTPVNIPDPPVEYQAVTPAVDEEEPLQILDKEEVLFFSYFSTAGSFDRPITRSTGNTEVRWGLSRDPEEPVPVWIVVRDGRGGTAWCHSMVEPE